MMPVGPMPEHWARDNPLSGIQHSGFYSTCKKPECTVGGLVADSGTASIRGVGPDAPTETDERGASQSKTPYAVTSLDARALLAVAAVQARGDAKYGPDNWRGIVVEDHLNHAMVHVLAHQAGDTQEQHLAHAACRMLMALATSMADEREDDY